VGRERGLRLPDVDLLVLLPAWGVAEDDIVAYDIVRLDNSHGRFCCSAFVFTNLQRLRLRDAIIFSHRPSDLLYFSAAPALPSRSSRNYAAQLER
jgi:hypothetical protein